MSDATIERQRYELQKRNQATMAQVNKLVTDEASKVLTLADSLDQQTVGGMLRTVVPGLVDKYGKVNAALAAKYYDEQRALWRQQNPTPFAPSSQRRRNLANGQNRKAERVASAKLRSEIYVASVPDFNAQKIAEPIIGWGMSRLMDEGTTAMRDAVTNSLTRAVGSYNRDTLLYNAGLDTAVWKVQRVAEPNACAFCIMVAFSSPGWTVSDVRTADYAIDFHDHCKCSIETLYEGDKPFRPDYYDGFEQQYIDATSEVGTTNTKDILAALRKQAKP